MKPCGGHQAGFSDMHMSRARLGPARPSPSQSIKPPIPQPRPSSPAALPYSSRSSTEGLKPSARKSSTVWPMGRKG